MKNEPILGIKPDYPEISIKRPPTPVQCAKELFNLPEDWEMVCSEVKNFDKPTEYFLIKGAVYPEKFSRGPRKGRTNFRKPAPGTECEVPITCAAQKTWLSRWEAETGLCHHCKGSGWKWSGWGRDKGNSYRHCSHCELGEALRATVAA